MVPAGRGRKGGGHGCVKLTWEAGGRRLCRHASLGGAQREGDDVQHQIRPFDTCYMTAPDRAGMGHGTAVSVP